MTATQDTATNAETPAAAADQAGRLARLVTFIGTILIVIALSVLPLLTPYFIHAALDAADSAARLGVTRAQAHQLSDRSVDELVLGPGTFEFEGPTGTAFYDASERGHLREARLLLWLCLGLGAISATGIGIALARARPEVRRSLWRTVSRAGATAALAVVALGVISLVAFSALFTLFHQVFFPAGNWAFDPNTQRMVQLYPFTFWQIAAGALGGLVLLISAGTWLVGRTMARPRTDSTARGERG